MVPYLLHLCLLAEIFSSKSQTAALFAPNASLCNTLIRISRALFKLFFHKVLTPVLSEGTISFPF